MTSDVNPGYARPAGAQESARLATGDESRYADGRKVGEITYRFGVKATVTRDMPGWYVADGTQPDLIVAGVNYGKPNLSKAFVIGADGSAGFTIGATGGAAAAGAHTHAFTEPDNHAHTANHTVGQPNTHAITQPAVTAHGLINVEVIATPGSGLWVGSQTSSANLTTALAHVLGTNVGLDHNHDGVTVSAHDAHTHVNASVGAVAGAGAAYPPYVAVWPLIKIH